MNNNAQGISDAQCQAAGKSITHTNGISDDTIPNRDPQREHKKRHGKPSGPDQKAIHKEF